MASSETPEFSAGHDNPAATGDDGTKLRAEHMVITMQPHHLASQVRAPMPVSSVNWRSFTGSQFIPIHGLDFLIGVTGLSIQQTVELGDLTTTIESENRYTVRAGNGETLYMASEVSSPTQRFLCGSGRACSLRLHDTTRQEALVLQRRLAAASCCFPCRLQEMKVIVPPGNYIGRVQQQWAVLVPCYLVRDAADEVLFAVEGPATIPCRTLGEAEFKILSADSLTQQGTLVHRWDRALVNYTTIVDFPQSATQPKHKALLMGAAFLLEYTYFEMAKNNKCCRCKCL